MYIYTGGEPLVRKHDLIKICEKHPDCAFLCFTNATLIDEEFCKDMIRVGNFVPAISAEGNEHTTDARRGEGTYAKIETAMDLLRSHQLPFGISCCWTRANADTVATEQNMGWMIEKGALFCWYFHFMPVGRAATADLIPTPEQRERMYRFVREMREKTVEAARTWAPVANRLWDDEGDPMYEKRHCDDRSQGMAASDMDKYAEQGHFGYADRPTAMR